MPLGPTDLLWAAYLPGQYEYCDKESGLVVRLEPLPGESVLFFGIDLGHVRDATGRQQTKSADLLVMRTLASREPDRPSAMVQLNAEPLTWDVVLVEIKASNPGNARQQLAATNGELAWMQGLGRSKSARTRFTYVIGLAREHPVPADTKEEFAKSSGLSCQIRHAVGATATGFPLLDLRRLFDEP